MKIILNKNSSSKLLKITFKRVYQLFWNHTCHALFKIGHKFLKFHKLVEVHELVKWVGFNWLIGQNGTNYHKYVLTRCG